MVRVQGTGPVCVSVPVAASGKKSQNFILSVLFASDFSLVKPVTTPGSKAMVNDNSIGVQ